jgi:hypothetical protein
VLTRAQQRFIEAFSLYLATPRDQRDEEAMTELCQRALDDLILDELERRLQED